MLLVYIFNFIDRQILAILAESIKNDLGLSDTQIGALSGVAFGLFYATLGIPIARMADRRSRVTVISVCLAIWSAMTALLGLAQNYWQLLAARVGVGIGEAGGTPPSVSLLADYFPAEQRASAMATFALGIPIGVLFGNLLGGWINDFFGWRVAFCVVGIPGILLAIVVKLTVREPPRIGSLTDKGTSDADASSYEVLRTMWSYPTFRHLAWAGATQAFIGYGTAAWLPAFLIRTQDMTAGEVGTALGLIIGISAGIGTYLGGWLADRLNKKTISWSMWLPAIGMGLTLPTSIAVFVVDDLWWLFGLYAIPMFATSLAPGPTLSVMQTLAPPRMRASAFAIMGFISTITGLMMGPTVVGFCSDLLQDGWNMTDTESLRWVLMIISTGYLITIINYLLAAKYVPADLARSLAHQPTSTLDHKE